MSVCQKGEGFDWLVFYARQFQSPTIDVLAPNFFLFLLSLFSSLGHLFSLGKLPGTTFTQWSKELGKYDMMV
jgi:hypothetical protein